MEQNNKLFEISWPFWQCQAILPNAIGHDIFVWLYLSLLVRIVKVSSKPSKRVTEKQMDETRRLIREKFSKELISDTLLKEIEEKVKKEFCEETQFKDYDLTPEAESFLNSFQYLFGDDVEVKTIYKDAVSGAIMPYFDPIKDYQVAHANPSFKFDQKILRPKEPSASLVLKAIKLSQSVETIEDPIVSDETKEEAISEFYDEYEEVYEDDTLNFGGDAPANDDSVATMAKTKKKRTVKVLEDTYQRLDFTVLVHEDEHGELLVDPPIEFPMNKATTAWFNMLFKRAMLTNESLAAKVNEFFPKPKVQENIDPKNMLKLFSEQGKLDKCQELYETVGHSQTCRADLQLEVIRINDNFHAISGFFHVGRLLDLLGKTIPDTVARNTDYETFKIFMGDACKELGLDDSAKYKLCGPEIHKKYSLRNKASYNLPFKELFANAILNNLACQNNPFLYKEVVEDAWHLYDMRSKVDHPNVDVRLSDEDIKKLTKLAKFIISIQGGKTL